MEHVESIEEVPDLVDFEVSDPLDRVEQHSPLLKTPYRSSGKLKAILRHSFRHSFLDDRKLDDKLEGGIYTL
jgi:hypothetical protein